jgi:hypothetical protein
MLSIEQCKKILNSGEQKYSDAEIKSIRSWLYSFGELVITLDKKSNDKEESTTIQEG